MGSSSDLRVFEPALQVLDRFGVSYETEVVSAHRTPHKMLEWAGTASARGLKVVIAGAGGAAHLPGMVASATRLPVIGVPVALANLAGLDSLLSIVQMPRGVPVATVAIDNASNAALLAVRILAINDARLTTQLEAYALELEDAVASQNAELVAKLGGTRSNADATGSKP